MVLLMTKKKPSWELLPLKHTFPHIFTLYHLLAFNLFQISLSNYYISIFLFCRIYDLQQSLSEANRRRDEGMHTMDILLREKDHANQADKLNLTSKVADTVEDVNKRLLSKEIKMREEMQERYLQLERVGSKTSCAPASKFLTNNYACVKNTVSRIYTWVDYFGFF